MRSKSKTRAFESLEKTSDVPGFKPFIIGRNGTLPFLADTRSNDRLSYDWGWHED